MPSLLRRNLACFYCGSRSAQKYDGRVRQFECEHCEAVNYLDEKGQITDPPAQETPKAVQYARSRPLPTSPVLPSEDTLFCRTCLNNQQLLTQALASYLPPPNDPNYVAYESSYPEYKRNLEKRYPQVCADCAPRVRARIKAAGYAAKTDHLRRMMEQTKHGGVKRLTVGWGWRNMVVSLAGLTWALSILIQIAWHAAQGLQASSEEEPDMRSVEAPTLSTCANWMVWRRMVNRECLNYVDAAMGVSIAAGAVSFWWNNRMSEKVGGSKGRLVGLWHHLQLQIVVMVVRVLGWAGLQDLGTSSLTPAAFRGAHLLCFVFLVIATVLSLNIVRMDSAPRIKFVQETDPLELESTSSTPTRQTPSQIGSTSYDSSAAFKAQSPSYIKPFPINHLASPTSTSFGTPSAQLFSDNASIYSEAETTTTINDDDSDNAMDWTPTRVQPAPLQLRRPIQSIQLQQLQQPTTVSPSPFYGHLPAAPISPAHKLRNPPNQTIFRKAPASKQKDFFSKLMAPRGVKPLESTATAQSNSGSAGGSLELTPGKFQLKEKDMDTGLEDMFTSVFSIKDEPAEVRDAHGTNGQMRATDTVNESTKLLWSLTVGLASAVLGYFAVSFWTCGNVFCSA